MSQTGKVTRAHLDLVRRSVCHFALQFEFGPTRPKMTKGMIWFPFASSHPRILTGNTAFRPILNTYYFRKPHCYEVNPQVWTYYMAFFQRLAMPPSSLSHSLLSRLEWSLDMILPYFCISRKLSDDRRDGWSWNRFSGPQCILNRLHIRR